MSGHKIAADYFVTVSSHVASAFRGLDVYSNAVSYNQVKGFNHVIPAF